MNWLPSCLSSPLWFVGVHLHLEPSGLRSALPRLRSALPRQALPAAELWSHLSPRSQTGMLTARMCQRRLGFAVQVAPSGIEHPKAGNGLWLSGRAEPGTVVALYPGIVYPPLHYKCLPASVSQVVRPGGCKRAWQAAGLPASAQFPALQPWPSAQGCAAPRSGQALCCTRACTRPMQLRTPVAPAASGDLLIPALLFRHMPGYPRVDRGNDTLLARYDGSVVDALPWQQLAAPAAGDPPGCGVKPPLWRRMLEVGARPCLSRHLSPQEWVADSGGWQAWSLQRIQPVCEAPERLGVCRRWMRHCPGQQ